MARPEAGPPPVETSSVARVPEGGTRVDLATYRVIADSFRREDRREELLSMFGGNEDLAGRFLAVALHAISQDSDLLLNAAPATIIQAVKDSAAMGLEPTGLNGEGWIIRYKTTAVFQPGWRGYLKRIRNSRAVQDIDVQIVYENDEFDFGWTQNGGWFKHVPAKMKRDAEAGTWSGRGDYWGAYAYAVMPSGFVEMDVMPTVDINAVRDNFSQSVKEGKASPWDKSWSEMARKTVLRRLSKRLPQSAVDLLLAADARIEQLQAAEDAGPRIDVTRARNAALAASTNGPLARLTAGAGSGPVAEAAEDDEAAPEAGAPPEGPPDGSEPPSPPSAPLAGPAIESIPFDDTEVQP